MHGVFMDVKEVVTGNACSLCATVSDPVGGAREKHGQIPAEPDTEC